MCNTQITINRSRFACAVSSKDRLVNRKADPSGGCLSNECMHRTTGHISARLSELSEQWDNASKLANAIEESTAKNFLNLTFNHRTKFCKELGSSPDLSALPQKHFSKHQRHVKDSRVDKLSFKKVRSKRGSGQSP
jgi:hypothetical protein